MQNSRKVRRVSRPVKSASRALSLKYALLFSCRCNFVARLLEKYQRSRRLAIGLARILIEPRTPVAFRQFHFNVKLQTSPQFVSNSFLTSPANPQNEASGNWRAAQVLVRLDDAVVARSLARGTDRIFARITGPILSARIHSGNPTTFLRDFPLRPVPRVFVRSSHTLNETAVPSEVGRDLRRAAERQTSQLRSAAPDFAPEQVTRLTDQVLQAIDRRIVAQRERWGKV